MEYSYEGKTYKAEEENYIPQSSRVWYCYAEAEDGGVVKIVFDVVDDATGWSEWTISDVEEVEQ